MAETFPISGSIDSKAFPFLLMDLHRQGATGSLKVDGPSYQKALYFRGGRVLFGSSNDPRDQLGAILIESGKITPEQLEEVNAKVGSGNPLAKVLADSGFVSQRELGEAARTKVERILSDVIAYESGSFEFEDGVLPKGAVDLKLSTERLVLAAVRRISDRNFVLRHLSGLEGVLAPTGALAAVLPEIRAETAGLPAALDGQRSLKEAAARSRLDEFEAGKIACALLFLGLVEPAAAVAGVEPELDLGQTARLAFDHEPATVVMPSQPSTVIMDSFPAQRQAPPTETGFSFAEPSVGFPAADSEPIVIDAEPPPAFDEAPTMIRPEAPSIAAPRPRPAPPALTPPPRAAQPTTGPASQRPAPPSVRPPTPRRVEAEAPLPPGPRPSKDDLAALDALLHSRSVEGPLAPIEKPAQAWEPRFGQPSGRAARRDRAGLRLPLIAAVLVLLLAGSVGAWYYLGLGKARTAGPVSPTASRPAPSAPTTLAAALPPPSEASPSTPSTPTDAAGVPPTLAPSDTSSPLIAPPPSTAAAPTAAPPITQPAPQPPTAAAGAAPTIADARNLLRQGRLPEAAQGFASTLRQSPAGSFSIQLLVACSDETVAKALASVSAPDLYILPVNYKGRPCYRVCWGLYESEERADSGVRSVPDYFRKGGSPPRVVPTSGLLP